MDAAPLRCRQWTGRHRPSVPRTRQRPQPDVSRRHAAGLRANSQKDHHRGVAQIARRKKRGHPFGSPRREARQHGCTENLAEQPGKRTFSRTQTSGHAVALGRRGGSTRGGNIPPQQGRQDHQPHGRRLDSAPLRRSQGQHQRRRVAAQAARPDQRHQPKRYTTRSCHWV